MDDRQKFHSLNEFDCEECGGIQFCESIMPAFNENNIAISMVSSDEYAPFAAVVIASIIENSTSAFNYDIVLLTNDMLQRNKWRIEKMQEQHSNISIRVLDISRMIENFTFYTWAHFTSNTYYRLLTPDVFENYDKVIYLDSDIVVNHDIAELFQTDISGHYMAAAYDTHVVAYCTQNPPLEQRDYNIRVLKMKDPEQYFQAGVSLFNIKEIKRDFKQGYLIEQGMANKLRWLDQDLLNMLFYGRIKRLSNQWNVMVSNIPENLDEYHLPSDLRKEYYDARRNPFIVHYVGRAIPCNTTEPDLYEHFWKYARKTIYYEILLQKMTIDYAEKLAESVRIQLRTELKSREGFRDKVKRFTLKIADVILPKGSNRRIYVKKIIFRLKRWR